MASAVLAAVMITGCDARVGVGYRVYDPYYRDYHPWDGGEIVYYNRWANENHFEHHDYRRLRHEDQRRYWEWRHRQSDHRDHR
jgi:hypothetical protein